MRSSKWQRLPGFLALALLLASATLARAAGADEKKPATRESALVEKPSGLEVQELVVGTGAEAKSGDRVQVNYTGWLADGTEFASTPERGRPLQFRLGAGTMIAGMEEGIAGMRVGGKRKLVVPPALAYKDRGAGGVIPPNATLTFEVELVDAQPGR